MGVVHVFHQGLKEQRKGPLDFARIEGLTEQGEHYPGEYCGRSKPVAALPRTPVIFDLNIRSGGRPR